MCRTQQINPYAIHLVAILLTLTYLPALTVQNTSAWSISLQHSAEWYHIEHDSLLFPAYFLSQMFPAPLQFFPVRTRAFLPARPLAADIVICRPYRPGRVSSDRRLRTVVIVTDAKRALATESVGPEATELNVGLGDSGVGVQKPCTEHRLSQDVKNGVSDDLTVDRGATGSVSDTPDDGVDGPDDESETSNGGEEVANLATLGHGLATTVDGELPDDDEVGNACDGVPSPLLGSALGAESGEQTGEDHDDVGDDGDQDVATVKTGEQAEVEQEERGGQAPVDVAGPVDLAVDILVGVRDVLVGLGLGGVVVADTVASGLNVC